MTQLISGNSAKNVMRGSAKACLVAAVALTLCVAGNESAHATAGSVPLGISANPYAVNTIVDTTGVAGQTTAEVNLEAIDATVDIGNGVMANVVTFNGMVPGPEFRLKVGDTVIVHFQNKLKKEVTGIHWHGIELNNASDGTPLTQKQVKPGHKFDYKFTVTRPGVFWYHPHHHSSTNQVFQGLYGSLIVTEGLDAGLQGTLLPSAAETKTLVLSDITVCKAPGSNDTVTFDASLPHVSGSWLGQWQGKAPNILCDVHPVDEEGNLRSPFNAGDVPNIMTGPPVGEGQTVLTNGVNVGTSAPLNVQPGHGLRLQIINAAATRYMRLRLTNSGGAPINLVRIGGQGGLLDYPRLEGGQFNYNSGEILIPPGSREDVVAVIPSEYAGQVLTLWTHDYQRTGGTNNYAWIPTVPVMHLNVTGVLGNYNLTLETALRNGSLVVDDLCKKDAAGVCTVSTSSLSSPPDSLPGIGPGTDITLTNSGGKLGVNDIQGDHDHSTRPASARYARIGDTLELKVTNNTGAHHPFHLHGFSIQPISLSKGTVVYSYPYREFRDEIDIPSGSTLTFRVKLDDRPNFYDGSGKLLAGEPTAGGSLGRWLFHCHVLFHSTLGMISELDVVAAP